MDLPILILFLVMRFIPLSSNLVYFLVQAYFGVLLWRGGWGSWSFLMTGSIVLTLVVFLMVNYWTADAFDWR